MCVSYEVRTSCTCKTQSYLLNRPWRPLSPVRYEHNLHINSKALPVVCVSPVRYEHNLHINSKAVPLTCSEGLIGLRDVKNLTLCRQ
jgi:hypothetical protein